MTPHSDYQCWEIMNCNNHACPARRDTSIPCWEFARRIEAFHNVSNTCQDCVVFLLKTDPSFWDRKNLQNIIAKRGLLPINGPGHQECF